MLARCRPHCEKKKNLYIHVYSHVSSFLVRQGQKGINCCQVVMRPAIFPEGEGGGGGEGEGKGGISKACVCVGACMDREGNLSEKEKEEKEGR